MTRRGAAAKAASEAKKQAEATKPAETRVEDYLSVDPMEVEIGVGLIRLADPRRGGDLLERIQKVRQNVAGEIGIILPKVRIRDNMRLDQNQYRIKIADMPVAEGLVHAAKFLAMDPGDDHGPRAGRGHPRPGLQYARFVDRADRPRPGRVARLHGGGAGQRDRHASHGDHPPPRRRDPHPRLDQAPHRRTEADFAGGGRRIDSRRDEAGRSAADPADALARGRAGPPARADPGDPGRLRPADQGADLADGIRAAPPRRVRSAPATATPTTGSTWSRSIPRWRTAFAAGFEHNEHGLFIRLSPQAVEATCRQIAAAVDKLTLASHPPVVLVSPQIRAALRQMTLSHLPNLVVLSYNEITRDTKIEAMAMVSEGK